MPKIKFNLTDDDIESGESSANFEQPRPGVYPAVVKEITPGFTKDAETGKPDKNKPRLEVVLSITGDRYKNAQLWEYVSFSEAAKWKLAQFLLAFGLASKGHSTGEFDPAKLVGKPCTVRVKAGRDQSGEYRAEVGALLPAGGADGGIVGDEETVGDDFVDMGDVDGGDIVDDETMAEEDPWDARRAELMAKQVSELKEDAKAVEVAYSGKKKAEVVEAIIAAEQAAAEAGDEDIIEDESSEDIIDDEPSGFTEDQLMGMEIPELKEAAKQFNIATGGKTRKAVVAEILEAQSSGGGDGTEFPY